MNCGGLKCQYTHDKSLYNYSHALLFFFHAISFRNKGTKSVHPSPKIYKQYWIAHFHGPPTYMKQSYETMMTTMNYVFDLSSSHHHKAEVRTVHGECNKAIDSETIISNYATGEKGLVSSFGSHCVTENRR